MNCPALRVIGVHVLISRLHICKFLWVKMYVLLEEYYSKSYAKAFSFAYRTLFKYCILSICRNMVKKLNEKLLIGDTEYACMIYISRFKFLVLTKA